MKLNEKKLVLLGLTLSIPILLYSAPISIPVTFADGNVLTAAQLNQNFTAILNKINELDAAITNLSDKVNGSGNLLYPDGVTGEAVNVTVTKTSSYTVPDGKTLYITAYNGPINKFGTNTTNSKTPLIIKSGGSVWQDSSSSSGGVVINGYLK